MANEARVTASLQIRKTSGGITLIDYRSNPTTFQVDVDGVMGPTPGAMNISRNGTTISFSQLVAPGLCVLRNIDPDYFVEYGIWNPASLEFYPLGEILPGETYVLRFSRNLREEYTSPGTGTGTGAEGSSEFRMKAQWASGAAGVDVSVEAFER
jgi:hypothetical protein